VFKGRHFDRSVILLCVRRYLAYSLSLQDFAEMMAERGISVDHAILHRWTIHDAPLLLERFNWRKRQVAGNRLVDEAPVMHSMGVQKSTHPDLVRLCQPTRA
jgi:putative transposase